RHDINMAREAEIRRRIAQARIEIVHRAELVAFDAKAERLQRALDQIERARLHRRHRRAAHQRLSEGDRVGDSAGVHGRWVYPRPRVPKRAKAKASPCPTQPPWPKRTASRAWT